MLRISLALRHKIRDRGGNVHNFAFDTMTKVYREAVYAKDARYAGNPMYPESEPQSTNTNTSTNINTHAAVSLSANREGTLMETEKENSVVNGNVSSRSSNAMKRGPRRSGVQLEILSLYHDLLKETQKMKDPQTRENLRHFIRSEFNGNIDIPRRHVTRIEWQLHYGKNKLEELRDMRPDSKFTLMR
ncbi:Complex 1 LYR protein [Trypanosoma melophagium]|uniref:Complex 1 LYR protein n=1 Tax=Trypanosoma melophagium TaxID=715481 RepID=UPI003519E092|nr:Complex 1 LYR protein [Trypanosoma melophagium]